MLPHVEKKDLYRVEGTVPTHVFVLHELEKLGGNGWEGLGFKNHVLKEMGLNVDHNHSDEIKIVVYNKIIDAYNAMKESRDKDVLCDLLSINRMQS